MHRRSTVRSFGLAVLLLAACTSESGGAPVASGTVPAPSTTVHADDGTLLVGAVLPASGSAADLGTSMSDAITVSLSEINARGGFNGRKVRVITREEGDNPATAQLAVQDLVQAGVDAIIGPTSSANTLGTLRSAVNAGILTCSPTASALALDEFPDNGMFFRTIPSDSLEATALASVVEASGSSTAMVVYIDDAYGRPFAAAAEAAITAEGTKVSQLIGFTTNEGSIAATVAAVLTNKPDVIAVIADGTTGPTIINAIDQAVGARLTYVVNDAVRRPASSAQPFSAALARRVVGVSPLAYASSPQFNQALAKVDPTATGLYAQNAYDCLNIIALAANAAGSDQPVDIAAEVMAVTTSGTGCTSFTSCSVALAEGRNINYNGPSGNLSIDSDGDVSSATFERFTFDATGRDIGDGTIIIGSG